MGEVRRLHWPEMTRPLLFGLFCLLTVACGKNASKEAAPAPSASAKPAPPAVPANVDVKLLALLEEASKSCEETPKQGRPNCNSPEKNALVSSFNRGERNRVKALPTFAYVFSSSNEQLQGLAAGVLYAAFRVNLGPEAKPGSLSPQDASALMNAVVPLPEAIAMPAMPAVTHAMMLTKQGPQLFEALKNKGLQVRSMAYRFVMVYGRLAAFEQVKALAKDPESAIVLAALEGPRNMQHWSAEEQDAVCPWAESLLDDARPPVASGALALLSNCTGPHLDKLLERAEKAVTDKQYSFVHATALREMCREDRIWTGRGASEAQCKRARAVGEKVVQSTQLPARVRALALNGLGSRWPDKQTLKLVKQLKRDAAPEVKLAAERLDARIEAQLEREANRPAPPASAMKSPAGVKPPAVVKSPPAVKAPTQ